MALLALEGHLENFEKYQSIQNVVLKAQGVGQGTSYLGLVPLQLDIIH